MPFGHRGLSLCFRGALAHHFPGFSRVYIAGGPQAKGLKRMLWNRAHYGLRMSFATAALSPYKKKRVRVQYWWRELCNCGFCGKYRKAAKEVDGRCRRCHATLYGAYQGLACSQLNRVRAVVCKRMSHKLAEARVRLSFEGFPVGCYDLLFAGQGVPSLLKKAAGQRGGEKKICIRECEHWCLDFCGNLLRFQTLEAAKGRGYLCFKATKGGDMLCAIPPLKFRLIQRGADTDSYSEQLVMTFSTCLLTRTGDVIYDRANQQFGPGGEEALTRELRRYASLFNLSKGELLHPGLMAANRRKIVEQRTAATEAAKAKRRALIVQRTAKVAAAAVKELEEKAAAAVRSAALRRLMCAAHVWGPLRGSPRGNFLYV